MEISLKGKVAVVTGGTAGIGLAAARTFAREGAQVAICSRKAENVKEAVAALSREGRDVVGRSVDVSDYEALSGFASHVEEEFGGIDVWVSNASILVEKKLIDTPIETWKRIVDINMNSVFYGGLIAADKLKRRGGGVLINAASFATLMPSVGSGAYAATKAAIGSMTRSLAAELAPYGIRVVGFIPGVIETPMTERWVEAKGPTLASQHALQRIGQPEEVANALLFLASDLASFITGTCLEVTGGKFCVQNPADAWAG